MSVGIGFKKESNLTDKVHLKKLQEVDDNNKRRPSELERYFMRIESERKRKGLL